ncbi:WxL domain-containing protein [Enterococcus crotali]|uniref:WxL domain-containing protein n=1 Tax=Enterococcus crotali TaxID=1453587 RepID=UPI0004719FA3|nr:WxL domain-containing protein [Enterococcus crotali]OTP50022.1 hypothetical protein A5881_001437 [Enterococcus termitis]
MKKAIMVTLLSSAALMLVATPANAAEKETKTDVGVSFISDDPTVEAEDMRPFKNNLAVVFKPSSFQFGNQKAVGGIAMFANTTGDNGGTIGNKPTTDKSQYIVVNDDRDYTQQGVDGKNSPWTLKANLSELKTSDGAATLQSAKITMALNEPKLYNIGAALNEDETDFIGNKPWEEGALEALPNDTGVVAASTVTLEAGGTTKADIFTKKDANTFRKGVSSVIQNVKLNIVDSDQQNLGGKSFTGKVHWTLNDAPVFN